jgi:hypothetical protein
MARDLADPPPDVAPAALWRSLLTPRPVRVLSTRLRGAEHLPLLVRAVPAMAEARARDAAAQLVEHARDDAAARELLALVLYTRTPDAPAFRNAAALDALESHELAALLRETLAALADIAPTRARSNRKAWSEVLRAGARRCGWPPASTWPRRAVFSLARIGTGPCPSASCSTATGWPSRRRAMS